MNIIWLIPALPALGFVILTFARRLVDRVAPAIGVGSVGLSALVTLWVGYRFLAVAPAGHSFHLTLWSWMRVGAFSVNFGFYLDPFSLVMTVVITFVAFFIHLYSSGFMAGDEGRARFFSYMNLFVASMLVLVLADNLVFLFLGWEGVGLCSYLLIGFWYRDPANARAAVKAFVVTRVGDAAMLIGLLLLFTSLGTLNIQQLLTRAQAQWAVGSPIALLAASLILAGAVGKSAQLPLQTWLPDAMAGPTPVSALIHAATMVTAGVYLIARTRVLFVLAPPVQAAVMIVGLATLLIAGFSALGQHDIKRVLAYSTMSQIGYMFLALGVGAWPAAIFHFTTHAFFKSLLFLGAGAVIIYMHHEHDLFKMGGLRKRLPVVFWTFLTGALSMAALPPLVAGFSSKDWILYWVWSSPKGGPVVWALALLGVLLTAAYTFRLVILAFFGEERSGHDGEGAGEPASDRAGEAHPHIGKVMLIPLVVLAVPAALIGLLETPRTLLNLRLFTNFVAPALPGEISETASRATEGLLQAVSELVSLLGIVLAWLMVKIELRLRASSHERRPAGLGRLLASGFGFDWIYDHLLVRPLVWIAQVNREDIADVVAKAPAAFTTLLNKLLGRTQNGKLRWYVAGLGIGAVILVGMVVFI